MVPGPPDRIARRIRRYPAAVRLYDERSGAPVEFPLGDRIGVYVCGITPYDSAHVGHAFLYAQFDVLARHLRSKGIRVDHVQNVTDVDDDILRTARDRGVDYLELADREIEAFTRDMAAIGIRPPTAMPRATQFVPQILQEVKLLDDLGCAYERAGTVYFRVAADPRYGRLSGLSREQMLPLAAERGGFPDDPNKDDPLDFVLWQRSKPGEPAWDSPWGGGRPGWHIECSTMARAILDLPVDIHGGGPDLIYPHHESELAQSECAHPETSFVRYWMHSGEVQMYGTKMSKSLGNLAFVGDLLQRYSPRTVRRLLLSHHYRETWEFREEDLTTAPAADPGPGPADRDAFVAALDDDLNAPAALAVLDRAEAAGEDAEWLEEAREILGLAGLSDQAER
jgi:L-cysteine:1D-myo-inositol 2-amino-2-deoxy-alpha-D-glucopyranoside ligase